MKAIVILIVVWTFSESVCADIFSCTVDGQAVFTDDRSKCKSNISHVELNLPEAKRVNYRYPERKYTNRSRDFSIFIESPESDQDSYDMDRAVERLNTTLELIFNVIPKSSHAYLKKTDFYIMIGPKAKLGGEKGGLRYFPKNGDSTLLVGDKRWSHAVVIYNFENFLWLSDLLVNKVIMHELAHAWHYKDWSTNYRILKDVWLSSRQKSLYLSQKDIKGRVLKPAYASANEKEYFSELSAIYFVGGQYYPFSRQDLEEYDPSGYEMIKQIWGL